MNHTESGVQKTYQRSWDQIFSLCILKNTKLSFLSEALGMQVSGQALGGAYNASLAKGIGGNAGWSVNNVESEPDNWRLNVAMTWYLR